MGVLALADGKTFLFRAALIVGLGSVVATIIYLTPVPEQFPQSCLRPCHELDWPMICRVKITLENYQTLSSLCGSCPQNVSDCYRKQCVTADGTKTGVIGVNRQFPGPNIQVCQNDIILIDVVNKLPGQSFGIHWRGQPQKDSPYMDGVPMITQCPIPSYTTFQYKFRALAPGTHLWQATTGDTVLENVFGGFIVRQPRSKDPQTDLYDTDELGHIVSINEWSGTGTRMLLINGKIEGSGTIPVPRSQFVVSSNTRHRFRVIHGGVCQTELSVDDHNVLVITVDGNPIKPVVSSSILISSGETIDFVLHTKSSSRTHLLRVKPTPACPEVKEGAATIVYKDKTDESINLVGTEDKSKETDRKFSTYPSSGCEDDGRSCVNSVEGVQPLLEELSKPETDEKFYLVFGYNSVDNSMTNSSYFGLRKIPHINNFTLTFPPSPLLSQPEDINTEELCNIDHVPAHCQQTAVCECVHVVTVNSGKTVELMLIDGANNKQEHVFHLHGNFIYHLATKIMNKAISYNDVINMDKTGRLLTRNMKHPPRLDTVTVPSNGVSVVRFKADNSGYWLLREERTRGMGMLIHVYGELPAKPENFPTCGNWVGPEYFLV